MVISWINAGSTAKSTADVDVSIVNGNNGKSLAFRFNEGAVSVKFHNSDRLIVGADDRGTRIYFMPGASSAGYKLSKSSKGNRPHLYVALKKWADNFPSIAPSSAVGSYELRYDQYEKCHYISIGALPR